MTATGTWALPAAALSELQGGLRQSLQQLVRDQLAEQRRFMLATFEAFARRMGSEIKDGDRQGAGAAGRRAGHAAAAARRRGGRCCSRRCSRLVPAVILGFLYWQSPQSQAGLPRELADARAEAAAAAEAARSAAAPSRRSRMAAAPSRAAVAAPRAPGAAGGPGGSRVRALRRDAARQRPARPPARPGCDARGAAVPRPHRRRDVHRRFLPVGQRRARASRSRTTELPTQKCDLVGNPFDDALSPAQRQSVAFANFAATLGQRTGGAITVEIVNAGRRNPVGYPEQGENSTAGDWNAVAAQNNRVEFRAGPGRVRPARTRRTGA